MPLDPVHADAMREEMDLLEDLNDRVSVVLKGVASEPAFSQQL